MIEVRNLTKFYGRLKALDNISFKAEDGEVLGFLGPNGAGKSTAMNIITGYISQSSGDALIDGVDVSEDPVGAKKNIGYLPEIPPLYPEMTVDEYLKFVYELKKCRFPRRSHLEEIRSLTKIEDVRGRVIRNLSKGYCQRVGFAGALVGNPKTLILDEPTAGLDPKQIIEMRELIKKLGKNHTVVLSSHILSEVEAVCGKITVINKGKIAASDTADNLSKLFSDENKLTVRIEGPKKEISEVLRSINGVESVEVGKESEKGAFDYFIRQRNKKDMRREIFRRMSERNWVILQMKNAEMSLEEIFLRLTAAD